MVSSQNHLWRNQGHLQGLIFVGIHLGLGDGTWWNMMKLHQSHPQYIFQLFSWLSFRSWKDGKPTHLHRFHDALRMFSCCLSFIQPDLHRSEQNTESTTISAHYHLVRSWIYDIYWHIISITHLWHYNNVSLTWSVRFICMLPCLPAPTNRLGISCCLCSTSFWNHSHTPSSPRLCIMLPMTSDRKLWRKQWLWVPFKHPI